MTVVRPRRAVWWLITSGAVMLVIVASLPWIWARRIESAVLAELVHRHGRDFAIIRMHVDGRVGERLDLYRKLWHHLASIPDPAIDFHPNHGYWHHHLVVVVSDNRRVYRYHWSLRQHRLVLQAAGPIETLSPAEGYGKQTDRWYHYAPTDLEHRRGVSWRKFPARLDVEALDLFYEFRQDEPGPGPGR